MKTVKFLICASAFAFLPAALSYAQDIVIVNDTGSDTSSSGDTTTNTIANTGDLPGGVPKEACNDVANPDCAVIFNGVVCNLGVNKGASSFNPDGAQSCAYLKSCENFGGDYYEKQNGAWVKIKTCTF